MKVLLKKVISPISETYFSNTPLLHFTQPFSITGLSNSVSIFLIEPVFPEISSFNQTLQQYQHKQFHFLILFKYPLTQNLIVIQVPILSILIRICCIYNGQKINTIKLAIPKQQIKTIGMMANRQQTFTITAPASHLMQIIVPPGLWTSYNMFAETRSLLKNPCTL